MKKEVSVYIRSKFDSSPLIFEVVFEDGYSRGYEVSAYELKAQRCSIHDFIENTVIEDCQIIYGQSCYIDLSIF